MEIIKPENALITSLEKALDEIDSNWRKYKGIIITGSWPGDDDKDFVMEAMNIVKKAKEDTTPLLGICLGHQIIGLTLGHKLKKLPERRIGIRRVGERYESFWHDYALEGDIDELTTGNITGVQYHPEYQSSKDKPHPVLKEFIQLCKNQ